MSWLARVEARRPRRAVDPPCSSSAPLQVCLAHGSECTPLPNLVVSKARSRRNGNLFTSPPAVSKSRSACPSGIDPGPFSTEHTESTDDDHRRHHQEKKESARDPSHEAHDRRLERDLPAQEFTA